MFVAVVDGSTLLHPCHGSTTLAAFGKSYFLFPTLRLKGAKCQYFREKLLNLGAAHQRQGEEGGDMGRFALSVHPGPSQALSWAVVEGLLGGPPTLMRLQVA
jgi:hypothetical protein